MNRIIFAVAFAIGLMAITWVGWGFIGASWMALVMTLVMAGVYLLGAFELRQFRAATASLAAALASLAAPVPSLADWLGGVPPALQNPVRLRIEGERVALPGPALTPYLVGLLVMLGMLGTFLGMVVTFKGAVFALEGSTDLQAIRSALAAPIKGLGLAFGTSVAGVAASAMLGLMSAVSRRERMDAGRQLDSRIATDFRPFSLIHQRQETFKALQLQAHALPDVAGKLQAMMDGMERRSQQLNEQLLGSQTQFHREVGVTYTGLAEQLLGSQAQFHREVSVAYTGLAGSVGQSLQDSLAATASLAGQSITPVVEAAMAQIAQESRRLHERVSEAAQAQLAGVSDQFSATARTVSDTWTASLRHHAQTSEAQVVGLDRALNAFTDAFGQRAGALLATVESSLHTLQSDQASADQQRQAAWTQALQVMAASLQEEWQRAGSQTLAQQQAICQTLAQTADQITQRSSQQSGRTFAEMTRLLAQSEALMRSRVDSEADWTRQHGERMDQLAGLWRTELGALRQEEAARGTAAVERLGELQAALATQLATLGTALETPMTRLMQTAAEVPQAAAGVITQLRQEMSRLTERDNLALQERNGLVAQLQALLHTLNQASGEQRTAIESLVGSAAAVLDKAGSEFSEALGAQAGKAEDMAAHVTVSAVELASLGESFNQGVQLFNASNEKLMDSLQRIGDTMNQATARSDDQLAYYVAQAREVIDLSITSQQGLVEDMRQLRSKPALRPEGVAG